MSKIKAGDIIRLEKARKFTTGSEEPTLLMQSDPRQVVTANKLACEIFNKDLSQIEAHRGGQVFDCLHSFSKEGCGIDENCNDCIVKDAVVDTLTTGNSNKDVAAVLDIKKNEITVPHEIQLSTKKVGDYATITIHKFKEKR